MPKEKIGGTWVYYEEGTTPPSKGFGVGLDAGKVYGDGEGDAGKDEKERRERPVFTGGKIYDPHTNTFYMRGSTGYERLKDIAIGGEVARTYELDPTGRVAAKLAAEREGKNAYLRRGFEKTEGIVFSRAEAEKASQPVEWRDERTGELIGVYDPETKVHYDIKSWENKQVKEMRERVFSELGVYPTSEQEREFRETGKVNIKVQGEPESNEWETLMAQGITYTPFTQPKVTKQLDWRKAAKSGWPYYGWVDPVGSVAREGQRVIDEGFKRLNAVEKEFSSMGPQLISGEDVVVGEMYSQVYGKTRIHEKQSYRDYLLGLSDEKRMQVFVDRALQRLRESSHLIDKMGYEFYSRLSSRAQRGIFARKEIYGGPVPVSERELLEVERVFQRQLNGLMALQTAEMAMIAAAGGAAMVKRSGIAADYIKRYQGVQRAVEEFSSKATGEIELTERDFYKTLDTSGDVIRSSTLSHVKGVGLRHPPRGGEVVTLKVIEESFTPMQPVSVKVKQRAQSSMGDIAEKNWADRADKIINDFNRRAERIENIASFDPFKQPAQKRFIIEGERADFGRYISKMVEGKPLFTFETEDMFKKELKASKSKPTFFGAGGSVRERGGTGTSTSEGSGEYSRQLLEEIARQSREYDEELIDVQSTINKIINRAQVMPLQPSKSRVSIVTAQKNKTVQRGVQISLTKSLQLSQQRLQQVQKQAQKQVQRQMEVQISKAVQTSTQITQQLQRQIQVQVQKLRISPPSITITRPKPKPPPPPPPSGRKRRRGKKTGKARRGGRRARSKTRYGYTPSLLGIETGKVEREIQKVYTGLETRGVKYEKELRRILKG